MALKSRHYFNSFSTSLGIISSGIDSIVILIESTRAEAQQFSLATAVIISKAFLIV